MRARRSSMPRSSSGRCRTPRSWASSLQELAVRVRASCQSSTHRVSYSWTWAGNPVRRSPATNDGTSLASPASSVSHRLGDRSAARRRSPRGCSSSDRPAAATTASSARWSSPGRSALAGRSPPATSRSRSGSRASSLRRAGKVPSAMPHTTARSSSTPSAMPTGPTSTPVPRRPCRCVAPSSSSRSARPKAATEGSSSVPSRSPRRLTARSTRSAICRSSSGQFRRSRPPRYFWISFWHQPASSAQVRGAGRGSRSAWSSSTKLSSSSERSALRRCLSPRQACSSSAA